MSNNFTQAIKFTLPWETGRDKNGNLREDGGYTNDPRDPGGETKWGIAKRYHQDLDIKNLTLEGAMAIYQQEYFDIYKTLKTYPIDLDSLDTASAVVIFDTGVNCGVGRTANWYRQVAQKEKPAKELLAIRKQFYLDKHNSTYENGWIARVVDLDKYITILMDASPVKA